MDFVNVRHFSNLGCRMNNKTCKEENASWIESSGETCQVKECLRDTEAEKIQFRILTKHTGLYCSESTIVQCDSYLWYQLHLHTLNGPRLLPCLYVAIQILFLRFIRRYNSQLKNSFVNISLFVCSLHYVILCLLWVFRSPYKWSLALHSADELKFEIYFEIENTNTPMQILECCSF